MSRFSGVNFAGALGFGIMGYKSTLSTSHCDNSDINMSIEQVVRFNVLQKSLKDQVIARVEEIDGDDKWEKEKSECAFCQYFLSSPCGAIFRKWSKCVDLSKEAQLDYVSVCSNYTDALMECSEKHQEFFQARQEEAGKNKEEKE